MDAPFERIMGAAGGRGGLRGGSVRKWSHVHSSDAVAIVNWELSYIIGLARRENRR